MNERAREQWGSRLGFTLAAVGSAVGLGNIWRFSYASGENGGAVFLLLYLLAVLVMGLPIMIAEFTIGRRAQSDVIGAFHKLAPGRPWVLGGYLGLLAAFVILSYYAVIAGWIAKYLVGYLSGELMMVPAGEYGSHFTQFTAERLEPLGWSFLFMALTTGIVAFGVKRGIEQANKILMPLLALLLVGMAAFSLSLPGAAAGVRFLFRPDWSVLARAEVYLAAVGQAFFSLSLGMGALLTYSSYLPDNVKLPREAVKVAFFDTLLALVAGLAIFPAVFSFGVDPAAGATLVFIVLPGIFEAMPAGMALGLAFFALLSAAALSSAVSLLEVVVAYAMRRWRWTRLQSGLIFGFVIFLLGIPSSLGYGLLAELQLFGRDILSGLDLLASQIVLPVGGLIFALFIGWGWQRNVALQASDFGRGWLGRAWLLMLRYLTPLMLTLVLLHALRAL